MSSEFKKPRRLRISYRNRFVERLTQTIESTNCTDAGRILKPGKNRLTLELTAAEWTRLFSAVMAGADLIYPEQSHDVTWLLWQALCRPPEPLNEDTSGINQQMNAGGATFDDLVDLMRELDVKFQLPDGSLYEPAIPLVPCGCGSDSGESENGALAGIPGATSGTGFDGDTPTLCDLIAGGFATYVAERMDDILGRIQQRIFVAEQVLSLFDPPLANSWIDQVRDNASAIELQLTDPTFLDTLNQIFANILNDPVAPPLRRVDLLNIARRIPLVQEGAPMQSIGWLWAASENLSSLNTALPSFVGQGDSAVCAPFFTAAGRTQSGSGGTGGLKTATIQQGNIEYEMRIYELKLPLVGELDTLAVLPFDYTDLTVVAGGYLITDNALTNPTNGNQQPRILYNNRTGQFGVGSDIVTGQDFHMFSRNGGVLTQASISEILAIATQVVGRAPDQIRGEAPTNLESEIQVSMRNVQPDGSATVSIAYIVHEVP